MLLANKGGRGRCKLADKWDSTLHVVVSMDTRSHTYSIRNTRTDQENLLIRANFLPVDEREDCVELAFDDSKSD